MKQSTTPVSYVGKHTFTQEEKEQKLQQMLASMRQKEEIEAELKTTQSTYKAKINAKDAEIKLTANLLNAGFEDRTFNCNLFKNFDEGKRQYFEIGTNALVGEEQLTAADYQVQMDLEEKAIQANNEAADLKANVTELLTGAGITIVQDTMTIVPNDEPEYTVEPDSNPVEHQEPELLGEAIVEPEDEPDPFGEEETQGGEEVERGSSSLSAHLSADDYDDPFSGIGSRDNALDIGDDDDEQDPFAFDDI